MKSRQPGKGKAPEIFGNVSLPNEVLMQILSKLDMQSLGTTARVCKYLKEMSENDLLWEHFAEVKGHASNIGISSKELVKQQEKVKKESFKNFLIDVQPIFTDQDDEARINRDQSISYFGIQQFPTSSNSDDDAEPNDGRRNSL